LTSTPYYDVIIGGAAALYLLFLVLTYNYFEGSRKYRQLTPSSKLPIKNLK